MTEVEPEAGRVEGGSHADSAEAMRIRPSAGNDRRCLVVMYHYVHDQEPITWRGLSGLTTREFCSQLDRLCRVLEPIDWPALYAWMEGRGSLPERSFLLTFDDGLADHAEFVAPILQERGLRGVFFVPGAILRAHRMLPAHAIHLLLSALGEERFTKELLDYLARHADGTDWVATVDRAAAEVMYHYEPPERARLKYLLTMKLPIDLRARAVEKLFERHVGSTSRWARNWYLGWDDLARIQAFGHTIGGHGYCHDPLSRLSPSGRRTDMRRAAAVLREGLGPDIRPFSYPYGSFDDDACSACQSTGFAHAFTTEKHWITSGCDPMRLPRIDTIDVDAVLRKESACIRA